MNYSNGSFMGSILKKSIHLNLYLIDNLVKGKSDQQDVQILFHYDNQHREQNANHIIFKMLGDSSKGHYACILHTQVLVRAQSY